VAPDRIALDLEAEASKLVGVRSVRTSPEPHDMSTTLTVASGMNADAGTACAGIAASPTRSAAIIADLRGFVQVMHMSWRARSIRRVDGTG